MPAHVTGEPAGRGEVGPAQRVDRGVLESGQTRWKELIRRLSELAAARVLCECAPVMAKFTARRSRGSVNGPRWVLKTNE
jgi:hypothetical protein